MPVAQTSNFGTISFDSEAVIEFPRGLPGFDDRRRFVVLQFPDTAPLTFLQSLEVPELCFITMPVLAVDPQYRLGVAGEDLAVVGLSAQDPPAIGRDVLCLTVLSLEEGGPTANLLAPVVVNLRNLRAVQAVATEPGYSHQHALVLEEAAYAHDVAPEGETILIGDDIEIVIAHIGRSRVKVGIRAPRQVTVIAREVKLVRDQNMAAARTAARWELPDLVKKFSAGASSFSGPIRKGQ